MKKYYLHDGSKQLGPFSFDELKNFSIAKQTPIWYEGLSDWTSAANVEELSLLFASNPPIFNRKEESELKGLVKRNNRNNANFKLIWNVLRVFAAIFLIFLVYRLVADNNHLYAGERIKSIVDGIDGEKEHIRNNILSYVSVGNSSYNYRLIGGISNLSLVVTNNSGYMLDDVKVKLSIIKADGGLWKEIFVDFTYVPANNSETIRIPDSDRGISVKYQIVSIKSLALSLN